MGRPNIFTEENKKRIFEGIQLGLPYNSACEYAGISEATFYMWKAKGKEESICGEPGPYSEFFENLKKIESDLQVELMGLIRKAAETDTKQWTAISWLLERRWPSRYGKDKILYDEIKAEIDEIKKLLQDKK